jgi:glucose/arabinose dehydrogenase
MFVRQFHRVVRAACVLLLALGALGPLACSEKQQEGTTVQTAPAATTAAGQATATPTPRERRRSERSVRTQATIEKLDETTLTFRLADGTSLTVERAKVRLPGEDRKANAKPSDHASSRVLPPLAVGQKHSLVIRYGADSVPVQVRVRHPERNADTTKKSKKDAAR